LSSGVWRNTSFLVLSMPLNPGVSSAVARIEVADQQKIGFMWVSSKLLQRNCWRL